MYGVGKRIGKHVRENSWAGRGQQAQAAFDFQRIVIDVNEVNWPLVVVLVALLPVRNLNIPSQPAMEDASPQSKHLIKQLWKFMNVVRFDDDNHVPSSLSRNLKLGVAPGLWALGLILAAWASGPTAARADNIDLALLDEAPKIMAYLHKQGYKNVGVLEFRVQKGKEHADFGTGTLNSNMATRLENALILLDDPADPIGVVRDASQHALSRDKKATYLTADGRKALMAASYPLAWGKEVVKPDAFLVGDVVLSGDNKAAAVTVKAFDKDAGEPKKVQQFTVKTDRSILGDAGQSFQLSKRTLQRGGGDDPFNDAAAASATSKDQNKDQTAAKDPNKDQSTVKDQSAVKDQNKDQPAPSADDNPVTLTVLYDGQPQNLEDDPASLGEKKVRLIKPQLTENQVVEMVLENKSQSDTLGVVLKVNGQNTLYQETDDAPNCHKWVLGPGKTFHIKGFYTDDTGDNVLPFKVLSDDETKQKADQMKDDKTLGIIEFHVFRSSDKAPDAAMDVSRTVNLRGLSPHDAAKAKHSASLTDLKNELAPRCRVLAEKRSLAPDKEAIKKHIAKRNLIGAGEKTSGGTIERVDFANPEEVSFVQIRYYSPS